MWRFIVGLLATVGTLTLLSESAAASPSSHRAASPPSRCRRPWCCRSTCATCRRNRLGSSLLGGGLFGATSATSSRPCSSCGRRPTIRAWSACIVDIGDDIAGLAPRPGAAPGDRPLPRQGQVRDRLRRRAGRRRRRTSPTTISPRRSTRSGCSRAAASRCWASPIETPFLKDGLDKLGVQVEGGKRWEYKSAPDTFTETRLHRRRRARTCSS